VQASPNWAETTETAAGSTGSVRAAHLPM